MRCRRCNHENADRTKFCGECGTALGGRCAACGASNPPTNKFCGECGSSLTGAPPSPKFGSPETYTPKHLVERILTSKAALEGERKQVTVLFADLKGSMELLADRDPEEARKLLDPVLERMMEAVHRYEGTVNQLMGDGIMALFGAPVAHEDHAVRACYAALDMHASIRRYAEEVRRSHGVVLQIRVGLNSGEVVVRAIGSDLRMDYSAVGQTTHLAARMEQLAKPDTTLLTADVLRLAEGFIAVTPLGPMSVKGVNVPIELYELTGAGPLRSRLHAAAARGLTRFVGREAELEQVRQAIARAAAGHGQVVAIVGEPGVGKSRLVWEVTHSHRTHGWLIVQAGSVSYGKATPYLPVIDLLRTYFRIEARDNPRKVRETVTGTMLTLDEALKPDLSAVLSLLDAPTEDPAWRVLDPPQRRLRTLDAVKRLMLRESQVQPVLVVFEDLHWIDAETQALLDGVVESVPTARFLLLVNYRPEYEHRWGSKTSYTQLRLDPLPPGSAAELLQTLLGTDARLQPLTRLLIERTEGNPFFLEESVRTLVETGVLVGDRGAHRLTKAIQSIQVPATVQAILAARIDRLTPQEKRLLQTAAVIGKDMSHAVLKAVVELPEEDLRRGLAALQAAEFLYETSLFPEMEYTFKHALTHEVAYGGLPQERRRALHARIAEAIEAQAGDRQAEHVERLAYHAVRGEQWAAAVLYLGKAGAKAFSRSANREAVVALEAGLDALTHLPDTPETRAAGVDLRLLLKDPLTVLGLLDRALMHLRDAERLAQGLDPTRQAWAAAGLSYYFCVIDRATDAWTWGERACALAEIHGDHTLRVATTQLLGMAALDVGAHHRAVELFRETLALIGADEQRERFGLAFFPGAMARVYLAYELGELGEFADAIAQGEEALRFAALLDHPHTQVTAEWRLAHVFALKGDLIRASPLSASAAARARQWELTVQIPTTASIQGLVSILSGRVAEGLALLDGALDAMAALGDRYALLEAASLVAEGYLAAGCLDAARTTAEAVGARAHAQGKRDKDAHALRTLGEVGRLEGNHRLARESLDSALAVATELGMRPLVAHCHLGLGQLYRRTAHPERAQEHLTTATTMYRDMGMTYWLDRAEADSA
jgi:class 3 adenylate cyclase/tetratricopeptide (TPR) repeat protein